MKLQLLCICALSLVTAAEPPEADLVKSATDIFKEDTKEFRLLYHSKPAKISGQPFGKDDLVIRFVWVSRIAGFKEPTTHDRVAIFVDGKLRMCHETKFAREIAESFEEKAVVKWIDQTTQELAKAKK